MGGRTGWLGGMSLGVKPYLEVLKGSKTLNALLHLLVRCDQLLGLQAVGRFDGRIGLLAGISLGVAANFRFLEGSKTFNARIYIFSYDVISSLACRRVDGWAGGPVGWEV